MKKILLFLATALLIFSFTAAGVMAQETVKIGFNAPLSGPAAAWGLPGMEGVEVWLDKLEADGGLKVGDETYEVEIVKYDNEGVGSKALLGARKLVEEDGVVAMLMLGGATSAVVQPYLTKHKVMAFVLIASDIAADRPYLLDVTDNFPTYHLLHTAYIAESAPKCQKGRHYLSG